jgi:basic membrane lipoprotein Med (substrate-binding protein (PBP1-ABC) superfamily)
MMNKRLAAILSADVVGFSRLMGADEHGTYEAINAHRAATDPIVEQQGGRIVGAAGDSILAEFSSVVDAVQAGIEIQQASAAFNVERSEEARIMYRIGVNLGDVIVAEDGDIFGDGVNIAARIQAMAPPGGVWVSDSVFRSVSRQLDAGFEDRGTQQFKNITDPIRVWSVVLDETGAASAGRSQMATNPYRGLFAFKEQDAAVFFGRTQLVDKLVHGLSGAHRFMAVVGPSGSGKSSVVRAGLLPALRREALAGSSHWLIAQMMPGTAPFAELEAALLRVAPDPPSDLSAQLNDGDNAILRAFLRIGPSNDTEFLLLVDQFEELFALVEDESVRRRFLNALGRALEMSGRRLRVVVTMRADFYDRPLLYEDFGDLFTSNMVSVMPLSSHELEAAMVEPARAVGVSFEKPLVRALLADVATQPGALPLFQYTLTELFDGRQARVITLDEYGSIGGLRGALTGRADQIFGELSPEEQSAAVQIFLRLVTVGEQGEDTRRRVPVSELEEVGANQAAMRSALDLFGRHRLVTFDRDPVSGAATVEVAHEALLRGWERLRGWIDYSRGDLLEHDSYLGAAAEWLRAGRDDDYLLSGSRLDRYATWAQTSSIALTDQELEFLRLSQERRAQESAAAEAREREQQRLEKRARKRLAVTVAAVVALFAVLGVVLMNAVGSGGPAIAIVYSGRDDVAIGAVVASGIDRAQRELGVQIDEVVAVASMQDDLRSASRTGELVITIGQDDGTLVPALLAEFPDTVYAAIDFAQQVESGSLIRVVFADQEGAFLVGAAAGLKTQTGKVGFVGGVQEPSIELFRAGFEAGVKLVDPNIEILAAYIEGPGGSYARGFANAGLGRVTAERLYDMGADIIFHAAGGSGVGVLEAAANRSRELGAQLWAIGVDADEYLQWSRRPDLQRHILTSMLKRWDEGVFAAVDAYVNRELTSGVIRLGLAEGGVGYAKSGGFIADIESELSSAGEFIVAGAFEVPVVPDGDLLPLLAASESSLDPADAEVLQMVLQASAESRWDVVEGLVATSASAPFGGGAVAFLEGLTVLEPEMSNMACTPVTGGAFCDYLLFDDVNRALGYPPSPVLMETVIEDGLVMAITRFDAIDDPVFNDLMSWLAATYPAEMSQACTGAWNATCARFVKLHLADYASRGDG